MLDTLADSCGVDPMVLICSRDEGLAKAIGLSVRARRLYAMSAELMTEMAVAHRPSVIFVDVRLGGSGLRAVELLPWLLRASPLSAIVVLTYSPTRAELEEIAALGAYTFIDLDAGDVGSRVRDAVSAAADRQTAGVEERPSHAPKHGAH
jgi:DNA-binding NarL/FixJ family response regulator